MSKNEGICFDNNRVISADTVVIENGYDSTQTLTIGNGCCDPHSSPELVIKSIDNSSCERMNCEETKTTSDRVDINGKHSKLNGNHTVTGHEHSMTADITSEKTVNMTSDSCEHNSELNDMGAETSLTIVDDTNTNNQLPTVHQTPTMTLTNPTSLSSHMTMTSNVMAENQMTFTTSIQGQTPIIQGNIVSPNSQQPMSQFTPANPQMDPRPPNLNACPIHQPLTAGHPAASNSPLQPTGSPPLPENNASSPNQSSTNGNQSGHQQHVVRVHIQPGETLTVRYEDQLQRVPGPAMIRMVSNNGPRQPMRMQLPPGHLVQQIADENGILTDVILSPQPAPTMMGNPIPGGPNNAPQYYLTYGGAYTSHPQYPSPHHHSHGPPTPGPRNTPSHIPHQHSTPPPTNCNNHGQGYTQGPSPPLNSMDDRATRQRNRMRKKHQVRENEGYYNRDRGPRRPNSKGTNDADAPPQSTNSINNVSSSHTPEDHPELEEERRVLQTRLSKMPLPKVSGILSRSAVIHLSPPDCDNKEFYYDPAEFCYVLSLSEVKDGKYKTVYNGDATEITLKDLKPATEYHVKVCTILDDMRGSSTEAISFKTLPCEPDQPSPPTLGQKSKTSLTLKWKPCTENGSKITAYLLECETCEGSGKFEEVYNGLLKQYKITKLTASSKYTFRLAAINSKGKSLYSDRVTLCTSGSPPSQPDPPMLSECYVTDLVLSWIKRPNDDDFLLQYEDIETGHGFLTVYNGPLLSYRLENLVRNKDYRFRLGAKNDEGVSKYSDVVTYRTKPSVPDPPGKPQIKGKIHAHSFRCLWDAPRDDGGSEVTKYVVELDDGKGYETLYEGSDREHMCDRLTPGHSYWVRVAAISNGGRSEFSEVCVATTQAIPPGQCSVPKLQGKPKATSLHLRWAYPENNGGSQVMEFSAQMILPDNTSREVYKGRDLDCIVAGLQPGRPYLFQVRAFNRAGGGPWSEPLEVVSGAGVPDPPKMPVCTCRSSHGVFVAWEGPMNNGATITDYRLEWQLKSDQDYSQLYYGPNTNYEVKGLSPATSYSFRVQAINSAGAGLYSPSVSCLTPPSSPSPVVSIRASPTANSVQLAWKEPNCNGSEIHSYNIDLGDKQQLICVSAVTEYLIEELQPETTYKVRIQAVNDIGVGAFSSPVKFTTRALPPRPPKLECNGIAPNSLKLKWGEGRNMDLNTFVLEMEKEDGNFVEVYKGQAYICKVNRLLELTSYEFRIFASNEAGSGPYSDTYTFTTSKAPPPALRAPKVDNITRTSCNIEWQSCKPMGEDRIVYLLQLQTRDQEFRQIYKGTETSYTLDSLHGKSDYHVRVCAIRASSENSELPGVFSPSQSFSTLSPEPVKPVVSHVTENKVTEKKQWTDQQLTAIVVAVVMLFGVFIAFVVQQLVFYRS